MILNPNQVWKSQNRRNQILKLNAGLLWLTRPGDPADRILETGDTITLKGRGWIAQALGEKSCDFSISTSLLTDGRRVSLAYLLVWPFRRHGIPMF